MKFRPEKGDLRVISAFLIGLVVGLAVMLVWKDASTRKPVYAVCEPAQTGERYRP